MVGVQTDHRADVARGGRVVTGQQHDLQAEGPHLVDGGLGGGLDDIGHADDTGRPPRQREVERGNAVAAHLGTGLHKVIGQGAMRADEIGVAARDDFACNLALQPLAGDGGKVRHRGVGELVGVGALQDRACQRVLAAQLQPGGHAEQEFFRHIAGADDPDNARLAGGDGAGLVQQDGVGVAGGLKAGGCFEQDAVFGTHTAADHDSYRRGQPQCAGAADDQHADAARQRKGEGLAEQQPDQKGGRCNADDGGHKDAGNLVGSLGQRGLGGGGIPHKADDLRQGGVLPDTLGPAGQCAVLVDGGGADRGAGELVHWHTLTGEGRLIDRGKPLGDGAVHRDALAGADQKEVADSDLADRDGDLLPIAQHAGGLGGQLHQALQRIGRFALAVGLQRFADCDQR